MLFHWFIAQLPAGVEARAQPGLRQHARWGDLSRLRFSGGGHPGGSSDF